MDVITPFRYCEYRELDVEREVIECVTLAGSVIGGMSMCDKHAVIVNEGLSSVNLVAASAKGDSIGQEVKDYDG